MPPMVLLTRGSNQRAYFEYSSKYITVKTESQEVFQKSLRFPFSFLDISHFLQTLKITKYFFFRQISATSDVRLPYAAFAAVQNTNHSRNNSN